MAVSTWISTSPLRDKRRQEIAIELDRGRYRPSSDSIAEAIMRYLQKPGDREADSEDRGEEPSS